MEIMTMTAQTKMVQSLLNSKYDTIYLRALKSWQNGQLSLAHGTETKNSNWESQNVNSIYGKVLINEYEM